MRSVDSNHDELAYRDFALVYDEMMREIDYPSWVAYILSLYQSYATVDRNNAPLSLLDLSCGTGSFIVLMQERGWTVTGIDKSSSMLAIAEEKLRGSKNFRLFKQDIRKFFVGEKFPLITCLCDSLNYLLSPRHLQETFKRAYDHLIPGGVFIADFNTAFKYREILGNNIFSAVFEDSAYIWSNFFDPESELCRMEIDFFHRQQKDLFRHFKEVHWQRLYEINVIKEVATKIGFSGIKSFGAFTFEDNNPYDERIFFLFLRSPNK